METKEIDINEIKGFIFERAVVDQKEIQALGESILTNGQQQAIRVAPLKAGGYQGIYGSQRYKAAIFAKLQTIRADVMDKPISDSQALILTAVENGYRANFNPYDNAMLIQRLMKLNIKKGEIAVMCHKSNSWVSDTLKIVDMPNDVIQSVKKGEIGIAQIRELHQIPDKKKLEILPKIKNSTVRKTVKEIAETEKMSKLESDLQSAKDGLEYYTGRLKESEDAEVQRGKVKSEIEQLKQKSKQLMKKLKMADKKGDFNKRLTTIAKLDEVYYPLLEGVKTLEARKGSLNTEISELTYNNAEFKKLQNEHVALISKKAELTEQLHTVENSLVRNRATYGKIKKVVNEREAKQKEIEKLNVTLDKHRTKTNAMEKEYRGVIKNIEQNRVDAKKFKGELKENENLASQLITLTDKEGQLRGIANNRKAHVEKVENFNIEIKGLTTELKK